MSYLQLAVDALDTMNQMPDNAKMEEDLYRCYVLDNLRGGQEAFEQDQALIGEEL